MIKYKNRSFLIVFIVITVAVILVIVQYNSTQVEIAQLKKSEVEQFELMREMLTGQNLSKLNEILVIEDQSLDTAKILLYYATNDCSSCVEKSMNLITEFYSEDFSVPIYVISNNLDNKRFLIDNLIEVPFFVDSKDRFQKWINFSYSPVFLYINKNQTIEEVYHVTTPIYQEGRSRFFEYLRSVQS